MHLLYERPMVTHPPERKNPRRKRAYRCTPKKWTKEQKAEYTELASVMEKCLSSEGDEDINSAWTKLAEQIETKARMVQEKNQEMEIGQKKRNPKKIEERESGSHTPRRTQEHG